MRLIKKRFEADVLKLMFELPDSAEESEEYDVVLLEEGDEYVQTYFSDSEYLSVEIPYHKDRTVLIKVCVRKDGKPLFIMRTRLPASTEHAADKPEEEEMIMPAEAESPALNTEGEGTLKERGSLEPEEDSEQAAGDSEDLPSDMEEAADMPDEKEKMPLAEAESLTLETELSDWFSEIIPGEIEYDLAEIDGYAEALLGRREKE